MTIEQRVAALAAAPNVLTAFMPSEPKTILNSNLHSVRVEWFTVSGNVVTGEAQNLIVQAMGDAEEIAYWLGNIPAPLRPAPAEVKYIASRTAGGWAGMSGPAQATAIQNFCNSTYKAANNGARDIREFTVSPVDGNTVKVSGFFNTGAGFTTWERMTWFIKLIDANGATSGANVEFHRVTGE